MWGFITIWLLVHVGLGSKSSIALDGFGRCHHICRLIYTYIHTYNIYNIIHRFVCLNIILCVRYIYIWMNILYIYICILYVFYRERGVCVCVCVCAKKNIYPGKAYSISHVWTICGGLVQQLPRRVLRRSQLSMSEDALERARWGRSAGWCLVSGGFVLPKKIKERWILPVEFP